MPPRRSKKSAAPLVSPLSPAAEQRELARRQPRRMADGTERAERYRSRAQGERDQAEADFFGAGPELPTGANMRSIESLLGEVLAALPMEEESFSTKILAEAWEKAVGSALAQLTELCSVERGSARIRALHPAARYQLVQLKPRIIAALNGILGEDCVKRVNIVS